MRSFNFTCQGDSHIAKGIVCQDASYSETNEQYSIAIVSDGHGSPSYFRSDKGSQFAVDIIKQQTAKFVEEIGEKLIGKPFTQVGPRISENDKTDIDFLFFDFFKSIILLWKEKIKTYSDENPLTDKEKETVEKKYQDEFNRKEKLEQVYGCTLMACVITDTYWFAFHLGDGKLMSFHDTEEIWQYPVPWDEKCFLNITTSICDPKSLKDFRYCYQGDGEIPIAVFLGSDGIDDSYGDGIKLVNFYIGIIKGLGFEGFEPIKKDIENILPSISKKGSKDDMSIAFIYDETKVEPYLKQVINWQIVAKQKIIDELSKSIDETQKKNSSLLDKIKKRKSDINDNKTKVEQQQQSLNDKNESLESAKAEMSKFRQSLNNIKEKIGLIENDVSELNDKIRTRQELINSKTKENKYDQDEQKILENKIKRLSKEKEDYQKYIERYTEELKKLTNETDTGIDTNK